MPSLRRYAADPLQVANIVIVNWAGAFDFSAQRVRSGLSRTSTLHPVGVLGYIRSPKQRTYAGITDFAIRLKKTSTKESPSTKEPTCPM
jgi:hypothetical protein